MSLDQTSVPPRQNFGMRGVDLSAQNRAPISKRRGKTPANDGEDSKRTIAMTLVAVGAGAFGLWAFTATGGPKDVHGKIYRNAAHCSSDGSIAGNECQDLWRKAKVVHNSHAPAYDTKLKCEAVHDAGQCIQPADAKEAERRTKFIPRMAGYVMGKLALGRYQAAPLYKLKDDEPSKYRMSAVPPPETDAQGRRYSAFVWLSRTANSAPAAAAPKGRPLFAKDGTSKPLSRGGFGQTAKASAGG